MLNSDWLKLQLQADKSPLSISGVTSGQPVQTDELFQQALSLLSSKHLRGILQIIKVIQTAWSKAIP